MEKNHQSNKNYFPNLDAFRFLGALMIMLLHIEDMSASHGAKAINNILFFNPLGFLAVCWFFVLSGFLITFLLLKEKQETGTVSFKRYYAKRTLRIWPLHYFILLLGFFILPYFFGFIGESYSRNMYQHFWLNFICCVLFLSPIIAPFGGLPETIGAIWSVGVEEVFYLFWPFIIKKTKNYIRVFLWIIIAVLILKNAFLLVQGYLPYPYIMAHVKIIIVRYTFGCMAIGGIGACLVVFEKQKILDVLFRKDLQWAVYVLGVVLLVAKVGVPKNVRAITFPNFDVEFYSLFFCFFIINIAVNPRSIINLNYKWMNYLGKISYGLYLYNPIMRILSLELVKHIFHAELSGFAMNAALFSCTIISTIFVSVLSYEFFEKYFLNMKRRFSAAR